jgi:hypothetical protein
MSGSIGRDQNNRCWSPFETNEHSPLDAVEGRDPQPLHIIAQLPRLSNSQNSKGGQTGHSSIAGTAPPAIEVASRWRASCCGFACPTAEHLTNHSAKLRCGSSNEAVERVTVLCFDEFDRKAIRQKSDNATDAGADG